MKIAAIKLENFRNFNSALIRFNGNSLIIGANDVGKTNLLYAIRLLLDRTIAESELEPQESDFHINIDGTQSSDFSITIQLSDIEEEAIISRLKGYISEKGSCFLRLTSERESLVQRLFIGHKQHELEEIDTRYYLKYIHFKYVQSSRNLEGFIRKERRNLLKISKENRDDTQKQKDVKTEGKIKNDLGSVNAELVNLTYVKTATDSLNNELIKLAHHNTGFSVGLEAPSFDFTKFLDQLELGASTGGVKVGLGGDGRNNQILLALWKAKSEIEHDLDDEAVIYCIEEPEAHLHPHQQRKLASYLCENLRGQVLTSTHSPHIASEFCPNSIIRLVEKSGNTHAANNGCSSCVEDTWQKMGYRMSVIPAETFFSDGVLLVEGPSEVLFYKALAEAIDVDLDFLNLCILSVDGVDFNVYIKILDALEIPWAMRTDNDVTKVPRSDPPKYRFSGLNRALRILEENEYKDHDTIDHPSKLNTEHEEESKILNPRGVFISKIDLENDIVAAMEKEAFAFANSNNVEGAVKYFQHRKAIRMGQFVANHKTAFSTLENDDLASPLIHIQSFALMRRS